VIRDQWYVVLESREIPSKRPVAVVRLGEKMVFWRDAAGNAVCARDRCCHRGAALSLGTCVNGVLGCPFHGFRFDGTGRVIQIPANGRAAPVPENFHVASWPVQEAFGLVWLWFGEARDSLPPLPFFEELATGWSWKGSTIRDEWPVHYTRAIENQLDVVHLPFVHRTTIGRGNHTLVHGPRVVENDQGFDFWVHNVNDDGTTKPMRPAEIVPSATDVNLGFRFANIWTNRLGARARIFAAFAPVDDERTVIYVRMYQKFLRLPLLAGLVNRVLSLMNRVILNQDKRVVITQEPRRSWLRMGENLVQGDLPIVTFRRRRDALRPDDGAASGIASTMQAR
jgi:phenylpropionate dioxygenase-like ring-hydroxylating dioxygenase large terminal subunit